MIARRTNGTYNAGANKRINQYSDGTYYVITIPDITKTGAIEKFPLPHEVVELLPEDILNPDYANEKLFHFCYSAIFEKYNNLVTQAKIILNKNEKITSHDNRNLFLSILSHMGVDSDLADRCLSHENQKTTKQIYLDVPYDKRKLIFEQWWKFLRGK
jgi:integrase